MYVMESSRERWRLMREEPFLNGSHQYNASTTQYLADSAGDGATAGTLCWSLGLADGAPAVAECRLSGHPWSVEVAGPT